jgi:hypothetical protein
VELPLAIVGLALACAAILLTVAIEWLKRPRLEIRPSVFRPSGPTEWTFAAVQIFNDPRLPIVFRRFITRQSADACEVWIEFRRAGEPGLALPRVPGRWSSQPEPIRREPVVLPAAPVDPNAPDAPQGPRIQMIAAYDQGLASGSRRLSVAASESGEEVAVAILRSDGQAFAFGAEAYGYSGWAHPEWELPRATYDVRVTAIASGTRVSRDFQLPVLSADFAQFTLRSIPS